jgi:Leucine-rich repeat (LRR) protein
MAAAIKKTMDMSKFSHEEISALCGKMKKENSSIATMSLKQVPLVDSGDCFESIISFINSNEHLKHLNCWGCKINDDLLRRLCWAITNPTSKSNLSTLNLGYNSITAEGVRHLADACWNSKTLSSVTIGSAEISIDLLKKIGETGGIADMSNLGVGPLSAILVGVLIRRTSGMIQLNISNNNLRKEGTNFLCRELAHYEDLMVLNIGSNEIFPSGVEAIAGLLRGAGGGLKSLSLAHNNITNWAKNIESFRAVIEAAMDCEILEELNLEGNVLRDEGAAMIGELIANGGALEKLNISKCQIGIDGGKAIAKSINTIGGASSLKILNLANNNLGSRGSTPIVEAMCEGGGKGIGLIQLSLEKNNIPQSAAMAMVDALSNNRDDWKLESISLVSVYKLK